MLILNVIYGKNIKLVDEYSFLIILFEDKNIKHIFYKFGQSCDTKTNSDHHSRTERVCKLP